MRVVSRMGLLVALVIGFVRPAGAQQPAAGPDPTELAKTSQNPVGDLVSLPFQFNFNSGGASVIDRSST